jgi:hypothetical protein
MKELGTYAWLYLRIVYLAATMLSMQVTVESMPSDQASTSHVPTLLRGFEMQRNSFRTSCTSQKMKRALEEGESKACPP